MTNLNRLTQLPNVDTSSAESKLEEKKSQVIWETKEKITIEEFRNMSLDDLINNTRIEKWKMLIYWKDIDYFYEEVLIFDEDIDKLNDVINYVNEKIESFGNQFENKELLINILQIWVPEAMSVSWQIWFKWIRNEDEVILWHIEKINNAISNFWIPVSEEIFNNQVTEIFDLIQYAELQKEVIWLSDMNKIREIFSQDISIDEKQIKIFNLMRYGGLSWNSEWVKNIIANKLIETPEFSDIKKSLENPKIREYIEDNNKEELEKLFWPKLSEELFKIYEKTKKPLTDKLKLEVEKINKKRKLNKEGAIKYEDYYNEHKDKIESETTNAVFEVFSKLCIQKKIESMPNRWKENDSLIWIYANLSGLWESSLWDYFTIADSNIDLAIDFATTIAIWAITMWAWIWATILTRGVLSSARVVSLWSKVTNWLNLWNLLQKWTTTWNVARFVWISTYEWIAFYEWATIMQNIMFKDFKDWGSWLWNEKEFVKNIAFMWALNSLKYLSKLPWMTKIMNFDMKIPDEYLKPGNFKKVLEWTWNFTANSVRDWSMMFWISWLTEELVWEDWHPTVREYLEFVVLIQVMHLKDLWRKQIHSEKLDK